MFKYLILSFLVLCASSQQNQDYPLLGGYTVMNLTNAVNYKQAFFALKFAVNQYNLQSNSDPAFEINKLLDAQIQVISGLNYQLHAILKQSGCSTNCSTQTCAFNVYQNLLGKSPRYSLNEPSICN